MGTCVLQAAPLGPASFRAASATDAFIAAFSWRLLSRGVMIGAEVGRMSSHVGDSDAPKDGPLMACPGKVRDYGKGAGVTTKFACHAESERVAPRRRADTISSTVALISSVRVSPKNPGQPPPRRCPFANEHKP